MKKIYPYFAIIAILLAILSCCIRPNVSVDAVVNQEKAEITLKEVVWNSIEIGQEDYKVFNMFIYSAYDYEKIIISDECFILLLKNPDHIILIIDDKIVWKK